jgi:hypothetical protein
MQPTLRFLPALALGGWLAAADLPVTISQVATGPASHVTLTNTASQPVTAWALATTTRAETGRTRREVETADGYLSEITHGLPGSSERLERLLAHQSRQIALDPLPAGAVVEVIAVVMDDGTAIGDEQVIASIFARRARERDALRAVVDAFNELLQTRHGAEALDALRERLTAIAGREQSPPCRAALDAVETYRGRGGSADAIDQSLRTYAAFVTREYELAAKHAQMKKP